MRVIVFQKNNFKIRIEKEITNGSHNRGKTEKRGTNQNSVLSLSEIVRLRGCKRFDCRRKW